MRLRGDRTFQWLVTLRDMVREIHEPDPLPSFQPVNVWVGTWNMGNAAPDADQLRHWLNLDHKVHELYAVGLQESAFKIKKAEGYGGGGGAVTRYLVDAFLGALGTEYKLVESKAMWEIRLLLFAHEELLPHVEVLDTATEACGIGGVGGNKGGVAVAAAVHRTTFCFVTAHLAAHQEMTRRRNRDCVDILKGLRALGSAKQPGTKHLDPSIGFHHTFFFGDLNYRINADLRTVLDAVEANDDGAWAKLHAVDQLRQEQSAGRALFEFVETPPRFAPTFKRIKVGSLLLAAADRLAAAGGPASGGTPGGCSFWSAGGADGTEAGEAVEAGKNAFEAAARVARKRASMAGGAEEKAAAAAAAKPKNRRWSVMDALSGAVGAVVDVTPAAPPARPASVKEALSAEHAAGDRVRIIGLVQRADLNGADATVSCWDSEMERWSLRVVGTNEDVLVRPACIVPISIRDSLAPRLSAIASSIGESEDGGGGEEEAAAQPSRPVHPAAALVRAATRSVASLSGGSGRPDSSSMTSQPDDSAAARRPVHPAAALIRAASGKEERGSGGGGDRSSTVGSPPFLGGRRGSTIGRLPRAPAFARQSSSSFGNSGALPDAGGGNSGGGSGDGAADEEQNSYSQSQGDARSSLYPSMYVADEREEQARRAVKLKYNAQRIPAWCDRVLVRSWNDSLCTLSEYRSEPLVDSSDHTPVFASFNVSVLLPTDNEADNESVHRHQWELTVFSAEVAVPLASLDEEDAAQARVAAPEITVEFYGAFVRTGYATRRLLAKLRADGDGGGAEIGVAPGAGPTLTAGWASQMELPVVDLYQQHGVPMMALTHLVVQVVAFFGTRRVQLGSCVLSTEAFLGDEKRTVTRGLTNCGVDTGGRLSLLLWLRDNASQGSPAGGRARSDTFRVGGRDRTATRWGGNTGDAAAPSASEKGRGRLALRRSSNPETAIDYGGGPPPVPKSLLEGSSSPSLHRTASSGNRERSSSGSKRPGSVANRHLSALHKKLSSILTAAPDVSRVVGEGAIAEEAPPRSRSASATMSGRQSLSGRPRSATDASDAGASTHDLLAQAEQGEIAVMPSPRGELVIDHAAPPPPPHSPPRAVAPPVRMTTEARLMQERAAQLATAGASQSGGLYSTAI